MDYYTRSLLWSRYCGLVSNRVNVINQLVEGAASVSFSRGSLVVEVLGRRVVDVRYNDIDAIVGALAVVDEIRALIWDMGRLGYIRDV